MIQIKHYLYFFFYFFFFSHSKMSQQLVINQNVNIKNDNCNTSYHDLSNNKIYDYNFIPNMVDTKVNHRNSYIDSSKIVGVLQNNNYDIGGRNISENTVLRNSSNAGDGYKRELETRLFPGAPLMSVGQSELKHTDLSSRLKYGEETRTKKSENTTQDYSANNFIPLVPTIAENIQNVDHIIPTYWVRGGMSSRSVIRNIDYMKSCGLKK